MIIPLDHFDRCAFCSEPPTHIRRSTGSNPLGGFDDQGLPRTEAQLLVWLESLYVTKIDWPDDLTPTCDQHLYFRWKSDGTAEMSPAGRSLESNRTARTLPAQRRLESYRTQVVRAYGGKCSDCGHDENLHLVRQPDTEPLCHPGGSKMRGEDKYRHLVRSGFPQGWTLRCADHCGVR